MRAQSRVYKLYSSRQSGIHIVSCVATSMEEAYKIFSKNRTGPYFIRREDNRVVRPVRFSKTTAKLPDIFAGGPFDFETRRNGELTLHGDDVAKAAAFKDIVEDLKEVED